MVFSSIEFLFIFLPVFLVLYYITPVSYKNITLLIGSLCFYAYGEPKFVILLAASMVLNYLLARGMQSDKMKAADSNPEAEITVSETDENRSGKENGNWRRKVCFALGLILNLAILVIFKLAPEIGLPLGVSFYTFQSLSYLIDVYRGDTEAETSVIKLGTYICMFPQLVAGPIVTYDEVKARLNSPKVTSEDFDSGLKDFAVGLAMKVLLADRLSLLWNEIAGIGYISAPTALLWLGSVSYSMQIYFDFFGYSLMAIGLGRMLGFRLPKNFDLPYMSESIREFYRRWHMTLGRWFSKYVYIPLGGSRNGLLKTLRNLFVVWVLTALWHGVSWNFILWGMLLCAVIMLEKVIGHICESKKEQKKDCPNETDERIENRENREISKKFNLNLIIRKISRHSYVLFVIVLSWTCFAVSDLNELLTYFGRMFGILKGVRVNSQVFFHEWNKYGVTLLIGLLVCTKPAHWLYRKLKDSWIGMIAIVILFWLSVWYLIEMGNNPFMYFRF